jgi:hypothetical protein
MLRLHSGKITPVVNSVSRESTICRMHPQSFPKYKCSKHHQQSVFLPSTFSLSQSGDLAVWSIFSDSFHVVCVLIIFVIRVLWKISMPAIYLVSSRMKLEHIFRLVTRQDTPKLSACAGPRLPLCMVSGAVVH